MDTGDSGLFGNVRSNYFLLVDLEFNFWDVCGDFYLLYLYHEVLDTILRSQMNYSARKALNF